MLCLVFAFRYLMQLQNEYSVMLLLCSRCGKVMILNVLKTGINAVSFLPVFQAMFLFLIARWRFRHTGSSGLARFFDYDLYWRTRACLFRIFVPPPTVPLHYVVNSGSFLLAFTLFIYFRSMSCLLSEANFHFRGLRLF